MPDLTFSLTLKGETGDVVQTFCDFHGYDSENPEHGTPADFAKARATDLLLNYYAEMKSRLASIAARTAVTI